MEKEEEEIGQEEKEEEDGHQKLMNCTAWLAFPLSGKWIAWNHLFCQSIQIEQSLKCMLEVKTLQLTRTIFANQGFALDGNGFLVVLLSQD